MTDWMTIRIVLTGQEDVPLVLPPGRVLLVHADHSFAELADAIDFAFARWDPAPLHEFAVEGRRLAADPDQADVEDSVEVTVGEVGLRPGSRFAYVFDLGARWLHDCTVEGTAVDPFELVGEEPEVPLPILGWGTIPDQYGRNSESEARVPQPPSEPQMVEAAPEDADWAAQVWSEALMDDDADLEAEFAAWEEAEQASWEVVAKALGEIPRPLPAADLATAAARLRAEAVTAYWPYDVLFAAGGLSANALPEADEQLWLELAAGVVAPRDETPLEPEIESSWMTLQLADWAGAVIGLVRGGIGRSAEPEDLVELIETCPEIELDDYDPEDNEILEAGFETVVLLWEALGAVDRDRRLTPLGRWGLPEALRIAWTS